MNIILFTKDEDFSLLPMEDRRTRHILRILKLKKNDSFKMGIINGSAGRGEIVGVSRDGLKIRFLPGPPPIKQYSLNLIIGLIRPIAARRILKDMTSMGIKRMDFVSTDTGEKSYMKSKLWTNGEYANFLISGAEQASSTLIPEVKLHYSLASCLKTMDINKDLIVLDNRLNSPPLIQYKLSHENSVLGIGPERGWSLREKKMFSEFGFTFANLGKRILRTETACSAGSAILISKMNFT